MVDSEGIVLANQWREQLLPDQTGAERHAGSPNPGVVTFSADAKMVEVREAVDQAINERGAEFIKSTSSFITGDIFRF